MILVCNRVDIDQCFYTCLLVGMLICYIFVEYLNKAQKNGGRSNKLYSIR